MKYHVYIIRDFTGPDRDLAFYSEEAAYQYWIDIGYVDFTEYLDELDQTKRDQALNVWNDSTITLVEKVKTMDSILDGKYLNHDVVKLIRMEITE